MDIYIAKGQTIEIQICCPRHGNMTLTVGPNKRGMVIDGVSCPFRHNDDVIKEINFQIGDKLFGISSYQV